LQLLHVPDNFPFPTYRSPSSWLWQPLQS
jgi:hypothetical protein